VYYKSKPEWLCRHPICIYTNDRFLMYSISIFIEMKGSCWYLAIIDIYSRTESTYIRCSVLNGLIFETDGDIRHAVM
jgi:hypothetical protein